KTIGIATWDHVCSITKYGLLYNLSVMFAIGLIVVMFAPYLVKMFIRDEASVAFATSYLRVMAFCFPFLGINFILNGIVRASGAMYQVLVLNIVSFWVLRYPLTFLFSSLFGEQGIAYGIGTSFIISSILASLYYRFGKWREKVLFKEQST